MLAGGVDNPVMSATAGGPTVKIAGGGDLPLFGLGTWQLTGREAEEATQTALEIGYRHIDTATGYGNEREIGRALRVSPVERDEVFITTKCPAENTGKELETLEASLANLGTEYVDLWLIHWPPSGQSGVPMWRAFIEATEQGKARAIGVSNYSLAEIDEFVEATGVTPALNQIPWSPFDYDAALVAGLAERGVVLEGYSAFKRSRLDDPVLSEVAAAHSATPAHVVLAWHLAHEFVVIPKATARARLEANYRALELSLTAEEVARIDELGQ
ncbi:MAG: aldo/keto reductase [Acidimicrobiaceae bacterium]|nr:aldo/keto reductase [Acidimicrobiaceae bacterium]